MRWGLQRGHSVIPKSRDSGRQRENMSLWDFELDSEDMESLARLEEGSRQAKVYSFMGNYNIFA